MSLGGVLSLPFPEQIAAFRLRLGNRLPTATWRDLWQQDHDRAFVVAGALQADLLADLGAAVDRAIAEGTSLETFRQDFRAIVERNGWHGWTGEGTAKGEAWRTRVIYRTNAATSYAAGRMAQLVAGNFPLWVYRHGGSRDPRPEHLSWDGLILPPGHPFWATHAPPNGWGCSCYVIGARSERDAVRKGGKPGLQPPPGFDRPDPKTGAPPGIDTGWAYAPGATVTSAVQMGAEKLPKWPYDVAKAFMSALPPEQADALATAYRSLPSVSDTVRRYAARVAAEGRDGPPPMQTLGLMTRDQVAAVRSAVGLDVSGFDAAIDASGIGHALRRHGDDAAQRLQGQRGVTPADFGLLLRLLLAPDSITDEGTNTTGRRVVRMTRRIDGEEVVALFEILPGRKRLMLATMWIRVPRAERP